MTKLINSILIASLTALLAYPVTGTVLAYDSLKLESTPGALMADFEGESYGDWIVTGTAFGSGPAEGTLPNQMTVSGYAGKRLVNSFYGGDGSIGTLTSPEFVIDCNYITFLIGGGGHEGKTCINLLLDGDVVRTATGPNTEPGGSEELALQYWTVSDLRGKPVTIQIVDNYTGGWGHINVDQIIQTNLKPKVPILATQSMDFTVTQKYLVIPIKNGVRKCRLTVAVDGKPVRLYDTELAINPDDVDWYAFFTLDAFKGKTATVTASRATEEGFALVRPADTVPGSETWYDEPTRPQFHFSQKVGWNNDSNGMVYLDGEWHLFFQHNPVGWPWGNMTWGHAISTDLVHWEQQPNKLFPKTMAVGDCFSGGGTVDKLNTAGFKTGDNDVMVVFLTDTGAGEAMAYSNDRGRSFTWYEGNPVVKHTGRDPKVIWYAYTNGEQPLDARAGQLGGHWVMAVYDEKDGQNIAFYSSTDMKNWTLQSHLYGYYECPEFFKLPIDGDSNHSRWVVMAADAKYAIGAFDGKVFTPEHAGKHQVHYGAYYASQTFDSAPNGRRIQIGWVRVDMHGMPFNQTFSFPHELTLRTTEDGVRLFAEPVHEIEKIHVGTHSVQNRTLADGQPVSVATTDQLFDIRATFEIGSAAQVGLQIGGERVVFDAKANKLNEASLKPVDGRVTVQVLVDRPMMEIVGNQGRVFITKSRQPGDISSIEAFASGGQATLVSLDIHDLKSIWR